MVSYGVAARDEGAQSAFERGRQKSIGTRPQGWYPRWIKPAIDRVGGTVLLLVFSPVVVLSAVLVRFTMGKPVLYVQLRVGKDGAPFHLFKLRTMAPDRRKTQEPLEHPDRRRTHKSTSDPRVLPVGRLLRSWRLDELPQFWNVMRGDMSLVGPRPEMPEIVAEYEDWQHRRHTVKPGLTGPWQISNRNGKPMHECTEMDLEYLKDMTLWHDLSILARTPVAMFVRRGY